MDAFTDDALLIAHSTSSGKLCLNCAQNVGRCRGVLYPYLYATTINSASTHFSIEWQRTLNASCQM